MDPQQKPAAQQQLLQMILQYAQQSPGLSCYAISDDEVRVEQQTDQKSLVINFVDVSDVLSRFDNEQKEFLQINFRTGKKILLTDTLIGFKPAPEAGLDSDRLPKVVTTSDLVSVLEAIEEANASSENSEIETLKKIFQSILKGAETAGFECNAERDWLRFLPHLRAIA